MSSFLSVSANSEAEAWEELQHTVPFPAYAEASPELAKATTEFNAAVGATKARVEAAFGKLQSVVAASASDNPPPVGELVAQIDASRLDRGLALQQLAEHWTRREQLAEQAVAEFSKRVAPAEKALQAAREKASKDLASIGCSVAGVLEIAPTMQLSEEAFEWIREHRVARVIAARGALNDANVLVQAASDQIGVSRQGKEETQKFVRKLVARLAAA